MLVAIIIEMQRNSKLNITLNMRATCYPRLLIVPTTFVCGSSFLPALRAREGIVGGGGFRGGLPQATIVVVVE